MAFWDDMNLKPCPLAEMCAHANGIQCEYTCYYYHSAHSLIQQARIPSKYQGELKLKTTKEDLETYKTLNEFKNEVHSHVKQGHGLYLYSPTKGNGKTSWAIKILREYLKKVSPEADILECRGLYVNVPHYMKKLKDSIDDYDKDLQIFRGHIEKAEVVVWDDIGREKPSDYSKEILYSGINYRYENDKSQIFTSNKSLDELTSQLGSESVDRILGQCMPLEFMGRGRREETAWWNTK